MFEVEAGTVVVFGESGVNGRADAAVRKDDDGLVGMPDLDHFKEGLDAIFEFVQSFFAVIGLDVALVVIPDFSEFKWGKGAVEFAEVTFHESIIVVYVWEISEIARGDFGGLAGAKQG